MKDLIDELRSKASELLQKKEVSLIIGYTEKEKKVFPCFLKKHDDIKRLVFNERSFHNLSVYLTKIKGKKGIIAKGCDIKSIIGLISENQINREDVVIIGISCPGLSLKKCMSCDVRNPSFYDFLIGERVEIEKKEDKFSCVISFEKKTYKERWDYFKSHISRCIRCYACRSICAFCYCEQCIVDVSIPQWIPGGSSFSSNILFHIIRALHLAGRCVDCRECERVCPVNIPLSLLNLKIEKDIEELFGYKVGDEIKKTFFQQFKKEDYDGFMG